MPGPVAAGEMRHRVTIYAPEGTSNALAGVAGNVATTVPAKIVVLPLQFQQTERLAVGGLSAPTVYNIFLHYRSDLQENFQLIEECCNQRTFNIVAMVQDDKMTTLDLTCVTA